MRARKAALRRACLERRRHLDPTVVRTASAAIGERLRGLPACAAAAAVHTYVDAVPNEVATRGFIAWCLAAGKRVVVPVVVGRRPPMGHAEIRALEELEAGPKGLLQPPPERARWWPEDVPLDLVVVPGVAFDRRGCRLGHGGGFYDAFLARRPAPVAVGLVYDELLLDEVPVEAHDLPVDLVLTPSAAWPCP